MHVFNCLGLSVFAARCSDEAKELILSVRRNGVRKQCPEMQSESPQNAEVELCQVVRSLIYKRRLMKMPPQQGGRPKRYQRIWHTIGCNKWLLTFN